MKKVWSYYAAAALHFFPWALAYAVLKTGHDVTDKWLGIIVLSAFFSFHLIRIILKGSSGEIERFLTREQAKGIFSSCAIEDNELAKKRLEKLEGEDHGNDKEEDNS